MGDILFGYPQKFKPANTEAMAGCCKVLSFINPTIPHLLLGLQHLSELCASVGSVLGMCMFLHLPGVEHVL
jgi:hypothetical protein